MPLTHETSFHIAADHPSLIGHFPGRPIVPGVVLLDRVIAAAERWLNRPLHVASLPQAKFLAPLLPEQEAHIRLHLSNAELRFTLTRAGDPIAQGTFKLAAGERT
jgi:3-hydroxyacyl-[acyl-carrier-protein] dehydratase